VRSERGYTLIEVLVVLGLIGVASAIALPVFMESNARSTLWTASENVGASIRQARLKAITQNSPFQVRFACPAANQLRTLVITGDPDIDDDDNRCTNPQDGDSAPLELPTGVAYTTGDATGLNIAGRGIFTAVGDAIPLTISVTYGANTRTLTVSATGQITFSAIE